MTIKKDLDENQKYLALGAHYLSIGNIELSIKNYTHALKIKANQPGLYRLIASCHKKIGQLAKALYFYKNSIILDPDRNEIYTGIGDIYTRIERPNSAKKSYELHLKYLNKNNIKIEHFTKSMQSMGNNYSPYKNLEGLPKGVIFVPSYLSDFESNLKYLMYIHIPKTGGVRFANPIWSCIKEWYLNGMAYNSNSWKGFPLYQDQINFLADYNIPNHNYKKALIDYMISKDNKQLEFTFLRSHGTDHQEICNSHLNHFGKKLLRLGFYRDPKERLISSFQQLWEVLHDPEEIIKMITSSYARNLNDNVKLITSSYARNLNDNVIFRSCFNLLEKPNWRELKKESSIDVLLNLKGANDLINLQSSLISQYKLPNIVTRDRLNVSKKNDPIDKDLLKKLLDYSHHEGFIELDQSEECKNFCLDLKNANLISVDCNQENSIHPITFLFKITSKYYDWHGELVPTDFLYTSKGSDYLTNFFQ